VKTGNYESEIRFTRNEANTPVTILVTGDVYIGYRGHVMVDGNRGTDGTNGLNGEGGLGGPGGFRGADGAYQLVNFASRGGDGLGPGGGAGSDSSSSGGDGTFVGVPGLLPLVGGSGGGGGGGSPGNGFGCSGGGGGGGGGAILIASNGTITVNGEIRATGGYSGSHRYSNCSSNGGKGSGGAIRLVADTVSGSAGRLYATGGGAGAIRMEAFTNTMSAADTNPTASRAPAPGPIVNPLMPTVAITAVDGEAVWAPPQGAFGEVDVIVPAPGPITIELATSGVPIGTVVDVTIKPRVDGAPIVVNVTLNPDDCDAASDCFAQTIVDLGTGAYTIEARATFQIP
jgi:hypothetical protein